MYVADDRLASVEGVCVGFRVSASLVCVGCQHFLCVFCAGVNMCIVLHCALVDRLARVENKNTHNTQINLNKRKLGEP